MRKLWNDDAGYVYVLEIILAATLLAIGLITGLVALRNAAVSEMHEVANALLQLNQSYSFAGETNCKSSTAGSSASDTGDYIGGRTVPAATRDINDLVCD